MPYRISSEFFEASILLTKKPPQGVWYNRTSPSNHVIPPGFLSLVLPSYVQDTLEECDLLYSCDTV